MAKLVSAKQDKEELKVKVFKAFDMLDDKSVELVKKGMNERVTKHWVYHFNQDGVDVWGVSKEGIDEITSYLSKFGIIFEDEGIEIKKDEFNPEYALAIAKVRIIFTDRNGNRIAGPQKIGTKRQWTKMMRYKKDKRGYRMRDKNGNYIKEIIDDPFWFEKATMKAIRNATRRLIEGHYLEMVIAKAKLANKVREVNPEEVENEIIDEEVPPAVSQSNLELVKQQIIANGDILIKAYGDVLEKKDVDAFHNAVREASTREEAQKALQELTDKIERRRKLKNGK